MKRRDFVKSVGAGVALAAVDMPNAAEATSAAGQADALAQGFARPPANARPHTWWHWMNGNVSAQGITLDLEAMARVGVGGVQMFDVGTGIPKGPVATLSPEWIRLVEHAAAECNRLGLSFTMHNCPGWSSSGGPWVTPDRAMQQLVWSETVVEGGRRVETALPKPFAKIGYYKDAYVLAYPSLPGEGRPFRELIARTSVSGGPPVAGPTTITSAPAPAAAAPPNAGVTQAAFVARPPSVAGTGSEALALADWDLSAGVDLRPAAAGQSAFLQYELTEPFEARSVIVHASNIPGAPGGGGGGGFGFGAPPQPSVLEASDDGVTWRKIAEFVGSGGFGGGGGGAAGPNVPLTATFPAVRAKHFRFGSPQPRRVTEFQLAPIARVPNWPAKTNLARQRNLEQSPATDLAPAIDPEKVVDITRFANADGTLAWDAPPGRWTVLRIGHTPTARLQNAASDAGLGLEIDKFSAEAMQFHFDKYFGELHDAFRPLSAKGLVGALVDSYEVGMQNWTPSFPAEFRRRRGYDLVRYMPAMTGRVVGDAETTERFLWDVRRAQADLIADNYYAKFAELCKQHGMKSHTEPYGPSNGPFDELQVGALVDEPMGEFWLRQAGAQWGWSLKLVSSIAHVWDKPVVGAESFTGQAAHSKWQEHPYATKAIGDLMYTYGLTRYIFHRYAHQPHPTAAPGMTMGPWGFHFDRTNTWFEKAGPWLQYVARAQHMLRQGLFVGDVLYVNGESAPNEMPNSDNAGKVPLEPAMPEGHDYDVIHPKALIARASVQSGNVTMPNGTAYRLLVLQPTGGMTVELARKLRDLVRHGAWLVGAPPTYAFGLADARAHDAEVRRIAEELWGTASETDRTVGDGRVFRRQALRAVLDKRGVAADFVQTGRHADRDIRYLHRRAGSADIYFVSNHQRRAEEIVASFRVDGKRPELWDAMTGAITPLATYEVANGRVKVPLRLDPSGSVFVVFREAASTRALRAVTKDGRSLITTADFAAPPATPYAGVTNDFTLSVWVKPEIEIAANGQLPAESTSGIQGNNASTFVVHPPDGEALYGAGHAAAGFTAGRDGVVVYERGGSIFAPVLSGAQPMSGWNHVAVVYRGGTPSLYVNGRLVKSAQPTGRTVHPGLGSPSANVRFVHFEGDDSGVTLVREALTEDRIRELATRVPDPDLPPAMEPVAGTGMRTAVIPSTVEGSALLPPAFLLWQNGEYALEGAGARRTIRVSGLAEPAVVDGAWRVAFQAGRGAPPEIELPRLVSLHQHDDPRVKYFAGTATYRNTFEAPRGNVAGRRVFIDLGRVEVIAELSVNGKSVGSMWKPPYRLDVTDVLRSGRNDLEVRVTTLWPNRLIGDEELPEEYSYGGGGGGGGFGNQAAIREIPAWFVEGKPKPLGQRITFTTWKHWRKGAPLLAAGLLGPVRVLTAARRVVDR
jgi:hypothetical protein